MQRLAGFLAAALVLVAAGCATLRTDGEVVPVEPPVVSPTDGEVEAGKPYADFSAPALDGSTVRLSDLVGHRVVLLQFWGIRCRPCLEEFALLERLQRQYGDEGLQVIGVNTDRADPATLREAMRARELAPPYPIVLDGDFSISQHYTRWLIPVSVLIDRRGIVASIHTGYKPALDSAIEAEIVQLLGR